MPELLRNDDAVLRAVNEGHGDTVVISFASWQEQPTRDSPGFAEALFERRGWSGLFVIPERNDWYQSPGSLAAIDAAAERVAGRQRIITYGSSMGGYAALNFAARVGAHLALSVIPQYSIDASHVPFEDRWRGEADAINFVDDPVTRDRLGNSAAFVIFDPEFKPDAEHADLIRSGAGATLIPLKGIGHAGPGGVVLREALEEMRSGRHATLPERVRDSYRRTKRQNPIFYIRLAQHPRWDAETRLGLLDAARELAPDDMKVIVATVQELLRQSRNDRAAAMAEHGVAVHPRSALLWSYLADARRRMRDYDRALHAVDRALTLTSRNHYYMHQRAGVLLSLGQLDEALRAEQDALAAAPGTAGYVAQLAAIETRIDSQRG